MGSVVAMVGARQVDSELVRLLRHFSYFGAGGRAFANSADVAWRFYGVVLFFVRVGFGLIFLFFLWCFQISLRLWGFSHSYVGGSVTFCCAPSVWS
ncbi:hypothetical protein RHMOL_Rhmol07G0127900 [Rhododendron molle]|uniref:Uncharacterized protein n=1 Tax=Rhododendron molle TaxID=49168 RepID=A0ACC0N106_RHOML|nr:hypothetical protein RHMOL_Rhmol07G0127900 [Rhododendron molle]